MNIIVLGAGAWGTALAVNASAHHAAGHQVTLWARDAEQLRAMQAAGVNTRYLPGVRLPDALRLSAAPLQAAVEGRLWHRGIAHRGLAHGRPRASAHPDPPQ
jgi:glycerol-3-phosphate dehydrogenase (NAD(P)+)